METRTKIVLIVFYLICSLDTLKRLNMESLTLDMPTLVKLFANTLSTVTILSCLFIKVPQIMYITERQSAEGIYIPAMAMEIFGFTIMTLYNYTNKYGMMTYMEYPIILFQVYIMMYFALKYKGYMENPLVPLLISIYFASISGYLLEILPKCTLSYLVPLCTPLSGFAKITYIFGMIKTETAENVSLTTWIISMLTNLARVFTVYVDSADTKLMTNFFVSTLLSSAVLGTALYYQTIGFNPNNQSRKPPARRRHND